MKQETKIILCPHCNSPVELSEGQQTAICPWCGSHFTPGEPAGMDTGRKKIGGGKGRKFEKKITTRMTVAFLILCVVFANRGTVQGIPAVSVISAVQLVLLILALLLGYQVIPNRKPRLRIGLAVMALVLTVPWVGLQLTPPRKGAQEAEIRYDQLLLGDHLPPLEGARGVVISDEAYVLQMELTGMDRTACETYIRQCGSAGFHEDDTQPYGGLRCYDPEGYGLTFSYTEALQTLRLKLEAPMDFAPFVWPREWAGELLPDPGVEEAMVERINDSQMEVYLKGLTETRFLDYQEQLIKAGFDQQVLKGAENFYGANESGSFVQMEKAGNGTIKLFLHREEPDRLPSLAE